VDVVVDRIRAMADNCNGLQGVQLVARGQSYDFKKVFAEKWIENWFSLKLHLFWVEKNHWF
jgi:hypothetical protein